MIRRFFRAKDGISAPARRPSKSSLPPPVPTARENTQCYPPGQARESRPAAGEANIILIAHPQQQRLGHRVTLSPEGSLEIGRSPDAEISLPDVPSVSRNHARLEYRGPAVIVNDLGSTNGTWINDKRIEKATVLKSGDRFQTGAVHFKFLQGEDVEHAYHRAIFDMLTRDGLTEICNKRRFTEELEREFARARRYARPLSLILLDIDRFKFVNDIFGHLAGDFVLKQIAGRMTVLMRPEQVFARVGGEEFAILCPETKAENAAEFAHKLRLVVAEKLFTFPGGQTDVTCSFGVAPAAPSMSGPLDLYRAADGALYRSKAEGRNAVSVESETPESVSSEGSSKRGQEAPPGET